MKETWNAMDVKDVGLVREVVRQPNGPISPIDPCVLLPGICDPPT